MLLLLGSPDISYSRELAILGLREVMGNRFVEYPKHNILYKSVSAETKAAAYGYGFSYSGKLDDLPEHKDMTDASVLKQIQNQYYDAIVFGKIGVWDASVLSSPFWHSVQKYSKNIAFLFGGDTRQSVLQTQNARVLSEAEMHTLDRRSQQAANEHLRFHLQFGTCFVRELTF